MELYYAMVFTIPVKNIMLPITFMNNTGSSYWYYMRHDLFIRVQLLLLFLFVSCITTNINVCICHGHNSRHVNEYYSHRQNIQSYRTTKATATKSTDEQFRYYLPILKESFSKKHSCWITTRREPTYIEKSKQQHQHRTLAFVSNLPTTTQWIETSSKSTLVCSNSVRRRSRQQRTSIHGGNNSNNDILTLRKLSFCQNVDKTQERWTKGSRISNFRIIPSFMSENSRKRRNEGIVQLMSTINNESDNIRTDNNQTKILINGCNEIRSSPIIDIDDIDDDIDTITNDCIINSEDSNFGEDDDDDDEMATYLRFGGVARLYSDPNAEVVLDESFPIVSDSSTGGATVTGSVVPTKRANTVDTVLDRLQNAVVVVVGLGGVGSWTAEALCRSGVGTIVLIDCDDICISNTNRQLHTTIDSIGQYKIDTMKQRLLSINPKCTIYNIYDFISSDNVDTIFEQIQQQIVIDNKTNRIITAVVDAIDNSIDKAALLATAKSFTSSTTNGNKKHIPIIISVGGVAGLKDPTKIICSDITDVVDDNLLRTTRKILRNTYNFPKGQSYIDRKRNNTTQPWYIDCVYSLERIPTNINSKINSRNKNRITNTINSTKTNIASDDTNMDSDDDNDSTNDNSFRVCDGQLGTACYVTGTLGFVAAGCVIDSIAQNDYN